MITSGTDAWGNVPTLRQRFFARFGVGAAIALVIVLATSLSLADALAGRWAARALLQDLEDALTNGPSGIRTMGMGNGISMRRMMGMGGTLMLTSEALEAYEPIWPDARRILTPAWRMGLTSAVDSRVSCMGGQKAAGRGRGSAGGLDSHVCRSRRLLRDVLPWWQRPQ